MMGFWKSVAGLVEVEITSADMGAAFRAINDCNISIYHVQQVNDLTSRFEVTRADFRKLTALTEKRGEFLRISRRRGIYWTVRKLIKRPVLVLGLALVLCLVLFIPTRVLFVRVEGNQAASDKQILAAAEECGIRFWASRREVRSEKMKNALLSAVPQLQWAGVNTYGCVAVISVRERTPPEQVQEESGVSSIVAVRDGIVDSITVTRGSALCGIAQVVKEGQILISGYTDCGIYIQAARAEGEVYAQTSHKLEVVTPSQYTQRGESTGTKHKYSLLIGKKRINLWKDSGIWDATCGRMYEEYYITLPGGFHLPVAFVVETFTFCETVDSETDQSHAEDALNAFAESYLTSQMVAGRILDRTVTVFREEGIYRLEGAFVCHEMIGRVRTEQIGE